jgi:hypothetical protein
MTTATASNPDEPTMDSASTTSTGTGTGTEITPDAAAPPAGNRAAAASYAGRAQANTSGFYRLQGENLQFAPNVVHAPDYILSRNDRARIALPKDGWDWFDTAEAAYTHHNLPLPQPEQTGGLRGPGPRPEASNRP